LKDFIFNMIKDEDEKRIIRGGLWWVIISVTDDGFIKYKYSYLLG
jgi:hypothetical protein